MTETLQLHSLPLFPLQTALFPGGFLALQVFEVRYLDMVGKAFAAGAPFGVVTLTQGDEVRKRAHPARTSQLENSNGFASETFHAIGTLARITEMATPQPGLKIIQCLGLQRFVLQNRHQMRHGLWIGDVAFMGDDAKVPVPSDLKITADALAQVIQNLQSGPAAKSMPLVSPFQLEDCAWVANRWCELLPISLELKHRLMSLDNPLVRLELVHDLLVQNGIAP